MEGLLLVKKEPKEIPLLTLNYIPGNLAQHTHIPLIVVSTSILTPKLL